MSEQAAPEPTMEEILASIRRIISEDDAPAAESAPAPAPEPEPVVAVAPQPAPEPEPEPEPAEDVLELTQRVEPPPAVVDDIEAYEPEPARPAPAPATLTSVSEEETLVSLPTSFAAASAFGQLSAAMAMPATGRTLEDLVRELLRPLLKEWLDQHLSGIVEAKVAEEVERIARRVR
jgi:cell pole-organizing protein PopZ